MVSEEYSTFYPRSKSKIVASTSLMMLRTPRAGVSKAHIFNVLVQKELQKLGLEIKSRPVELGYELRCCRPVAYDLTLCTLLGMGVRKLFLDGETGVIVSTTSKADIKGLPLKDMEDETGKIPPRPVDVDSELSRMVFDDMHVICPLIMKSTAVCSKS